jgi:hypothetical protein
MSERMVSGEGGLRGGLVFGNEGYISVKTSDAQSWKMKTLCKFMDV